MIDDTVPVRTPGGQAELGTRSLRLSQRHRTVLFLVDGRRSAAEVKRLAAQAGVNASCFEDLMALDLIAPVARLSLRIDHGVDPARADPLLTPRPEAAHVPHDVPGAQPMGRVEATHLDQPIDAAPSEFAARAMTVPAAANASALPEDALDEMDLGRDSLLPAAGTLPPDSLPVSTVYLNTQPAPAWPPTEPEAPVRAAPDAAFVRARDTLVRVVRSEAPLAGSLTLLRLRRASSRADLAELLAEVELRIGKRHRSLASAQTLKSVRMLLSSPITSRPMA